MDNIDAMEAGRELDALVAEKVMGRTDYEHGEIAETSDGHPVCARCGERGYWGDKIFGGSKCIPFYSTDIAAAWKVLEHFGAWRMRKDDDKKYWIGVWDTNNMDWKVCSADGSAWDSDAPLAICRAALKAVTQ